MSKQRYYRLVALWAVCEAMLGGLIHGLKLPISGLIVGGAAAICICMIGNYYPVRGAILKATIIVAIFKMMLSPQSPAAAYIAVFFQGALGELIFLNKKTYRLNCLLLSIITMLESAFQRLIVMTIIFGTDIWKAIDIFINGITGQQTVSNYSYYLAAIYVIVHLIAGIIIGIYAAKIPAVIKKHERDKNYLVSYEETHDDSVAEIKKKKGINLLLIIVWGAALIIYFHSLIDPTDPWLPTNMIIRLILRSIIILLAWILLINPILIRMLHRWLERKKSESESDIREIVLLLPSTQFLLQKSWKLSSESKGLKRILLFFKIAIFNSLGHG